MSKIYTIPLGLRILNSTVEVDWIARCDKRKQSSKEKSCYKYLKRATIFMTLIVLVFSLLFHLFESYQEETKNTFKKIGISITSE